MGLLNENRTRLEWVTAEDVGRAWEVFQRYHDIEWSYTDCVSLAVMDRMEIQQAIAFDKHFRQFGKVSFVPQKQSVSGTE